NIEECNRNQKQHAADCQRQPAIFQSNLQGPAVPADEPFIAAFSGFPELPVLDRNWSAGILARIFRPVRYRRRFSLIMLLMSKCFQNTAAKHRRQTQRNKA